MSKVYAYNDFFECECEVSRELPNGDVLYKDLMTPLCDRIKKMVQNGEEQVVVLVTGHTGSGKSNVGIDGCLKIDPKWSVKDNLIYSQIDFSRRLKSLKNAKKTNLVNLFDEGSIVLNSLNTVKKEDKQITVAFDILRSFGMVSFIMIPNGKHLNTRIKENHLNFMIMKPVQPVIKGYNKKIFGVFYVRMDRDWGESYWKPIGTSLIEKVPKKVWEEYKIEKLKHQWEYIDSMDDGIKC